jgi:hypothetical protein
MSTAPNENVIFHSTIPQNWGTSTDPDNDTIPKDQYLYITTEIDSATKEKTYTIGLDNSWWITRIFKRCKLFGGYDYSISSIKDATNQSNNADMKIGIRSHLFGRVRQNSSLKQEKKTVYTK